MTQVYQPDPPSPVRAPACPTCRKSMRLESAASDVTFSNLLHMIFICDCGWTSDQLVADKG